MSDPSDPAIARRPGLARWLRWLGLAVGGGLLAFVLASADVATVARQAVAVGWLGMLALLAFYALEFAADTYSWQLTFTRLPITWRWAGRLWKVRMVGEFFNTVVPAGGMGGEPVKVVLLHRLYAIGLREAVASLVVLKTLDMIALVLFLAGGMALVLAAPHFDEAFRTLAGIGLAGVAFATAALYAIQRFRIASLAGSWVHGTAIGRRIEGALRTVYDMDERLVGFYRGHKGRALVATGFALLNWLIGAVATYVTFAMLDAPIGFFDAWIVEAAVQLIRVAVFFVPAALGAQEGVLMAVAAAVTGSPEIGLAVALVRRGRELIWLAAQGAIGWWVAGRRPRRAP